jgi:hypothetical protein
VRMRRMVVVRVDAKAYSVERNTAHLCIVTQELTPSVK